MDSNPDMILTALPRLLPMILLTSAVLQADPVPTRIDLLDVIKSGEAEYFINQAMEIHDGPKEIWKFEGNLLHISGRGYGYVATKQNFRDYHLVIEFKWGSQTWGAREKAARDNGILLHCYGPHGAFGGTWMTGIEAQIIEGGVGDILVLSSKLPDGTDLSTSLSSEFTLDRDKEMIWSPGAAKQTVTSGRINWKHRDVDWTDTKGYRGREDKESPPGEWNRLECIARGDTLQYFLNGALVNEASACHPSEGRIALQCEGAEMFVRRCELWPPGNFKEQWNPIQASGGTDIDVRAGQDHPLSPEASQQKIQFDGPYEAQLVACEPLVVDPVECTWDAQGRLYVADMRDYPLGPPNPGDPWLSRIQQLIDEDGDGRMDRAVTFADHLDNVQGLLPYKDGLIATTRTQILFLKDTDGDGRADVNEPLIKGFNPHHSQLQVSAPRWGPDNWVYFNNGLEAAEIYPADAPESVVQVARNNFRWNPRTGKIEPTPGLGQYGGAFDDWGHQFFCSNRNPVMFAVMPWEAMIRNPHAGIDRGYEDIAISGAATCVYPLSITHTTADAHAGTNTACCGLGVYRGHLMPELKNNVFVCDPTGQLITRYKIEPNGASLKATRVGERTEWFRSADEWTRPVNFTTGPDGAIYVCDMYRRYIDHARFFPEEFVKSHNMREGESQGRIWRIIPRGTRLTKVPPIPTDIPQLTSLLNHDNAWQRETARRLLLEQGNPRDITALPESAARNLLLALASDPDVTGSTDEKQISSRSQAIHAFPEDPWIAKVALSSSTQSSGHVLQAILKDGGVFSNAFSPLRAITVRTFASASCASGLASDFEMALRVLENEKSRLTWWKPAFLQGLAEGLPKSAGKFGATALADFIAKPPPTFAASAREISALMAQVESMATDRQSPMATRLAVLPLLGQMGWDKSQPVIQSLLHSNQDPELTSSALALLKNFPVTTTSPLIYDLLPQAGPSLKGSLVAMLTSNPTTALALFKRMEQGEFPVALVDIETRWGYQRGSGELHDLAVKLFGQPSADRAAVISSYLNTTKQTGDATRGRQIFSTLCTACHKIGDLGADVGPSLADLKVKAPEALLSDILDPNRMFEARWCAYQVTTLENRTLAGLISSETAEAVTLTMPGGTKETVSRSDIKEIKSLDSTLMPIGLEAAISPEQMTDLLAFLLGK